MKNILTFALLFISLYSCKAQILSLYDGDPDAPEGAYYNDLNNDLDKFVGTWKWQQNDSILTIVLQKKEHVYSPALSQYFDFIIGEYKLEVNGQEVLNYLPRLQDNTINGDQYYISGNIIINKTDLPPCEDCNVFERRLMVDFRDPERAYIPGAIIFRHQTINNIEQLTAEFMQTAMFIIPADNSPTEQRVPLNDYILIKQ